MKNSTTYNTCSGITGSTSSVITIDSSPYYGYVDGTVPYYNYLPMQRIQTPQVAPDNWAVKPDWWTHSQPIITEQPTKLKQPTKPKQTMTQLNIVVFKVTRRKDGTIKRAEFLGSFWADGSVSDQHAIIELSREEELIDFDADQLEFKIVNRITF